MRLARPVSNMIIAACAPGIVHQSKEDGHRALPPDPVGLRGGRLSAQGGASEPPARGFIAGMDLDSYSCRI